MITMQELHQSILRYLPLPLAAPLCLVVGAGLASLLRLLVPRACALFRFNQLCDRLGVTRFLRTGDVGYTPGQLAGVSLFWATLVATFLFVAQLLDLEAFEAVFRRFSEKIPQAFTALLILGLGFPAVTFLGNFVRTLARNAGIPYAQLFSRVTKWLGWIFTGLIALEQMHLGTGMVGTAFLILFTAFAFGAALAFGLGCKDLARMSMERFLANLRENHRDRGGSDLEG